MVVTDTGHGACNTHHPLRQFCSEHWKWEWGGPSGNLWLVVTISQHQQQNQPRGLQRASSRVGFLKEAVP